MSVRETFAVNATAGQPWRLVVDLQRRARGACSVAVVRYAAAAQALAAPG